MQIDNLSNSLSNNYLPSKHFLLVQDDLLVESVLLTQRYGVPQKTILNGIHQHQIAKSNYWISLKNDHTYLIYLSTIPQSTITKYKIPSSQQIIDEIKSQEVFESHHKHKKEKDFHNLMLSCFLNNHLRYLKQYNDFDLPIEEKSKLAKSHAALDMLLSCDQLTIFQKFLLYNKVYDESFSFKASSYTHFSKKLIEIKNVGIENALLKKYYGNSNALKTTKLVYNAIMYLFKAPPRLSLTQITNKVNTYLIMKNFEPVSRTTVDNAIKKNIKLTNILSYKRNGGRWAKERLFPKLQRLNAAYPGDLYQMDGSRVQIAYKGPNNKPAFLVMVVLLDVCSRKVLAVDFGDSETAQMYESVLRRAIENTQFLPAEILSDNFKPFTNPSTGLAELMDNLQSRGVYWRKHRPGNPRDKGHIESFFNRFQHIYCKTTEGYVGEGVTSKNPDAHPNPEYITRSLKVDNLRTRDQLIKRVLALINNYNSDRSVIGNTERDTPESIFEELNKPNVIPLTEKQLPVFLYPKVIRKVYNSTITITRNGHSRYFVIKDLERALSMNNTNVETRGIISDNIVHCYHEITGEYLGIAEQSEPVHIARVNQTKKDKKIINEFYQKEKKLLNYIQTETENFEEECKQLDDTLVLLNPIRYTKDEVKNAEDRSVIELYPGKDRGVPSKAKRSLKKKYPLIINEPDKTYHSDNRIGSQITKRLFKK